jgi:hypothetical protein
MATNATTRAAVLAAASVLALYAAAPDQTFSRDVWPILEKRCVTCHQLGEIGPMPLTSYRQVRPWAGAIREAALSRAMPPWYAAPGPHSFRNDRTLSRAEIETIVKWVDAGAPEGDPIGEQAAPARVSEWKLGKPDLVIQVPGFQVPNTGQVPYSFLIVPKHFDRDTWVEAAEFRIDQRAVVHHINAFVRAPGSSYLAGFPEGRIFVPSVAERAKKRDGERVFERRQLLLGYEPGYAPMPWLEGGAKLIKAGSDIIFEIHYNPNGKAVTDYSEFGLYFAKGTPSLRVLAIDTLRDLDFAIPPGERNFVSKASMTLARPARLLSVQPHMHVRGKSMQVRAVYTNGRTEDLLRVPKYDFNWQITYVLSKTLDLPAGTRLESVAGFDNSVNNPFNPDAAATVRWGDQTTSEMHIAFLELVIDADADPDRLFQSAPKMIAAPTGSGAR